MSTKPTFVRVPAARGWAWLAGAHALFAGRRLYWVLLVATYLALTLMMAVVPIIGGLAATLLKPVFAVGFLAAAWGQERGERPNIRRLFAGFSSNVWALLPLGAVYAVGIALAFVASSVMDGGALMRLMLFGEGTSGKIMATPGIQSAMVVAFLCAAPTLLAMWLAPALIVFQDQRPLAALALSLQAAVSNLSAVLVYAACIFMFWVVLPGLLITLGARYFNEAGALFAVAVATPITITIFILVYIADYVVYRDLFHHGEGIEPASGKPSDD